MTHPSLVRVMTTPSAFSRQYAMLSWMDSLRGPREVAERQGEDGGRGRVRLARLEAGGNAGRGGVSMSN